MRKIRSSRCLIFWGYFWRYGIIGIAIILVCCNALIFSLIKSLIPFAKYAITLPFSILVFIMGVDFVLASIFKWPHIYLVSQSASHRKMDPYEIDWEEFNKKEYIAIGIILMVLSLAVIPLLFL